MTQRSSHTTLAAILSVALVLTGVTSGTASDVVVPPGATGAEISALIAASPEGSTVIFLSGETYAQLGGPIVIGKSVKLRSSDDDEPARLVGELVDEPSDPFVGRPRLAPENVALSFEDASVDVRGLRFEGFRLTLSAVGELGRVRLRENEIDNCNQGYVVIPLGNPPTETRIEDNVIRGCERPIFVSALFNPPTVIPNVHITDNRLEFVPASLEPRPPADVGSYNGMLLDNLAPATISDNWIEGFDTPNPIAVNAIRLRWFFVSSVSGIEVSENTIVDCIAGVVVSAATPGDGAPGLVSITDASITDNTFVDNHAAVLMVIAANGFELAQNDYSGSSVADIYLAGPEFFDTGDPDLGVLPGFAGSEAFANTVDEEEETSVLDASGGLNTILLADDDDSDG